MQNTGLYNEIYHSLTDRAFLKRIRTKKGDMQKLINETGLKHKARSSKGKGGLYATQTLEIVCELMERVEKKRSGVSLSRIYNALLSGLYPEGAGAGEVGTAGEIYLRSLGAVMAYAQARKEFDPMTDLMLATEDEQKVSSIREDYSCFLDLLRSTRFLELMHIGRVVMRFDMLAHVAGVHHIAMHMGRQLKRAGVSADLALVSASACLHDIGKYGCKGEESKRIPYLHYYYTEEFLNRHSLQSVAHIAANHSTWDLELENLPVESLLLIYADFRVKSVYDESRKEKVLFYSLEQAYDVILNKLDNVDAAKKARYERVYKKLSDFEQYLISLGVNTDPFSDCMSEPFIKSAALLSGNEAVKALKMAAVAHNVKLMNKISHDAAFADILEDARSEKDWKNIRAYVNIIEEYYNYMTQKQKRLTLVFLYELFMHVQGDIRSQAAALYGRILAGFDTVYKKELPNGMLRTEQQSLKIWSESLGLMLNPDFKLADKLRAWISYSLKTVLPNLINNCNDEQRKLYLSPYLDCFKQYSDEFTMSILLDSIVEIDKAQLDGMDLRPAFKCAVALARSNEPKYAAFALRFLTWALENDTTHVAASKRVIKALNNRPSTAVTFLLLLCSGLLPDKPVKKIEKELMGKELSELYLENLKTATPWVIKEANIRLLLYRAQEEGSTNAFQVATHLVNLIRVGEQYALRHRAGQALELIAPKLTLYQRNEIAVELTRGMQSANDEFAKYIPRYLGRFMLSLHPKELDEILDEFQRCIKSKSQRAAAIALTTVGVIIKLYGKKYRESFNESEQDFSNRRKRMLSLLLGGLAHYNEAVQREAFLVIGKDIFGGPIDDELKLEIFTLTHKKLLTLIEEQTEHKLTFYNNAASLNHIYRFIVDKEVRLGPMDFPKAKTPAFFPGTFDPFSSSHKAIVNEVIKQGFEVYLALDEFSWSKRTQPHMIRRRIVSMSVADMFDVYIFPDDVPVNIANPSDLKRLRELFPDRDVYIAVGSDVVNNASAYKREVEPYSIHSMGHIVFRRSTDGELRRELVKAPIIELTLDGYFEEISSTLIRENIDHNREISYLVDPAAQNYIYDNGLYLREPQFKELLRPENMRFVSFAPDDERIRQELISAAINASNKSPADVAQTVIDKLDKPKASILALFDGERKSPLGIACYYRTCAELLYNEFKNVELAEYTRRHTSGNIAVIGGIYARDDASKSDVMRLMITEVLAKCLMEDYTYALFLGGDEDKSLTDLFVRRGFIKLPTKSNKEVYAVDMRVPIAVIEDVAQRIKAPLSNDEKVVEALRLAQHDFSHAVTSLYPGRLVLSFHAGLLNHALVKMVQKANGVEGLEEGSKQLGECMCVPYGKTLRGIRVPNTVTKTLHADKAYKPDMKSFDILKYPGYSGLINQVRTIKSFSRPVILVDDLLHKGYRLQTLDPLFNEVGLDVKRIIVGILSGRGKDLMSAQKRQVDGVYFIPNLRYWFVDSMLYPFLGGDSIARPGSESAYLLPSINQIYPYTSPTFISGADRGALFELSLTCLSNARNILKTLERRHQEMFGNNLTLNRLTQAMQTARVPDKGGNMRYDTGLSPSVYVENDIEHLLRIEYLIKNEEHSK